MSIVTVVGNPRDGSRTLAVAVRAAEALTRRLHPVSDPALNGHAAGPAAAGVTPGSGPNAEVAGVATSGVTPGSGRNAEVAGVTLGAGPNGHGAGAARASFGLLDGVRDLVDVVDLAGLAKQLFAPEPSAGVEVALELVLDAEIVVVASPTYKGTYTGLLKAFLDKLPHQALAGKAALPLLVMGDPRHSLAVEVHLRPLLVELGAFVPTPGLAVLESQIPELVDVLDRWAGQVAPQLTFRQEVPA